MLNIGIKIIRLPKNGSNTGTALLEPLLLSTTFDEVNCALIYKF